MRVHLSRPAGGVAMPYLWRRIAIASFIAAASISAQPPAEAGSVIGDTIGVITDPLKIGKGSADLAAAAERVMIQLRELERTTNMDVKDRVEQVRGIVEDFNRSVTAQVQNIGAIADSALAQVAAIEAQTNRDAIGLVYQVQCATEVAVMDQMQRGLAEFVKNIKAADPGVDLLGVRLFGVDLKEIEITDPDMAYRSIKRASEHELETLPEDADPYIFVSKYQNLARLAKLFACHYRDVDLGAVFVRQENEYQRLTEPWIALGVGDQL